MTIADVYERRRAEPSDMQPHMPVLRDLASQCEHVTEFGVRSGYSTTAFLAGLPAGGRLVSYDWDPGCRVPGVGDDERWDFRCARTDRLDHLGATEMLFVDTLHDFGQVEAELQWATVVRRYIVLHDTVAYGCADESTGEPPGIMHAILRFLAEHQEWRILSHDWRSCGLLVLERNP